MTTLRNNRYFLILFGMFLFLFLFYNRFIRERLPRSLPTSFSTLQLIIYSGLFATSLIIFFTLIYKLVYGAKKESSIDNSFGFLSKKLRTSLINTMVKVKAFPKEINQFITKSLMEFHDFFVSKIPNYLLFHLRLSNYLATLEDKEKLMLLTLFLFLPQILVSICFIIDVLYVHKWNAFYKIVICLGYPMIIKAYFGLLNQIHMNNYDNICDHIIVGQNTVTNESWLYFPGSETDIAATLAYFEVSNMDEFLNKWVFPFRDMKYVVVDSFEELKVKYSSLVLLFTTGLYSIGWGYVLLHGFHYI